MSQIIIKCKCRALVPAEKYETHQRICPSYKDELEELDYLIQEIIKKDDKLKLINAERILKSYASKVNHQLQLINNEHIFRPTPTLFWETQDNYDINEDEMIITPLPNNFHYQNEGEPERLQFVKNEVKCSQCKSYENIWYLDCLHSLCENCMQKLFTSKFLESKCNICGSLISSEYIRAKLGESEFEKLEKELIDNGLKLENIVMCPKCHEKMLFENGQVYYNLKDHKNNQVSEVECILYAFNRCKCMNCYNEFCKICLCSPYHIGTSCEDHMIYLASVKCIYDEVVIDDFNQGPADNVCNKPECMLRYQESCKNNLECGHKCFGHNLERKCSPCLNAECSSFKDEFNQNSDSYCCICYIESLGSSPVVKLECGHIFHHKCMLNKLNKKWVGPSIIRKYLTCPSCNASIFAPNNKDIQEKINENLIIFETIDKMIEERLEYEDLLRDPRLKIPNDEYYNKPLELARAKMMFYQCNICNNPYFGGMKECNANNDRDHNPKELVCGGCAQVNAQGGITNCEIHGSTFIEYKCRFCCKIASFFCHGSTHYCDYCHSHIPGLKTKKCMGENCELMVPHITDGNEFALGCSLCRIRKV